MEAKWIFKENPQDEVVDKMVASLGFGCIESRILVMRGIDEYEKARAFFKPNVSDIHNPFLMKDMQKAVDCIIKAINEKKKILIYGDYDVDGVTSVSLMYLYLSEVYDKNLLDCYIPDRYTEGYGVSFQGINFAKENRFDLIISLDCGIKSHKEIDYAKNLGIDFIVCDHHLPDEDVPNATAILDPKQKDCSYPYKDLSGCGVGFKLCQALNTIFKIPTDKIYDLTDLLAISIASDIVPLTGENRTLAKLGLKKLHKTKRVGIISLIPKDKLRSFTISNIVFDIAPKINAAGRISHGKVAVELLISDDIQKTKQIVNQIIDFNNKRKELDSQITNSALLQAEKQKDNACLVAYSPTWCKGVIGIVASRLVEAYYKPTLIFTDGQEGEIVASARSVSDFDIHQAIEQCSDLLIKFGGHRAAAGLTMKKEYFDDFKNRIENIISQQIKEHQKTPTIEIDMVISQNILNDSFFSFHRKLAPFGPENMKPVLVLEDIKVINPHQIGKESTHIKFYIQNETTKENIECVGFGFGKYLEQLTTQKIDIAFSIEENNWRGNITYYLNIKDIKFRSE